MNITRRWLAAGCMAAAMGLGATWTQAAKPKAKEATPATAPTFTGDPYPAIVHRDYGTAGDALDAVEKQIHDAAPAQYPALEAQLLGALDTPDATMPAKQFICQMLRIVGSAKCVPTVSKLLDDEKLTHSARIVLLELPDADSGAALRHALESAQGNVRIGLINTLGDRQDAQALEALSALCEGDEATGHAALNAIGKIGGLPAAAVLDRVHPSALQKEAWASAYLRCAASLPADHADRAGRMYDELFNGDAPAAVRAGAFGAIVQSRKEQAVPAIIKLLLGDDAMLRRAAAGAVLAVPGHGATKALGAALAGLNPESKVVLLHALAARGDAADLTGPVNALAADPNPTVQQAALVSLALLGDASSVPVLSANLQHGAAFSAEARQSLIDLRGPGVGDALLQQAGGGAATTRAALFDVLAERRQSEALPTIRQATSDSDMTVRRAAWRTIGILGEPEDFKLLLAQLQAEKDDAAQTAIADAMAAVGRRVTGKAALADQALQALAATNAPTKIHLLTVLAVLGGDKALVAARESLQGEGELRKVAIRTLANWTDAAPLADLWKLAKEEPDRANEILALRGYIRLVALAADAPEKKLEDYHEALGLATRPDEKRLVLSGLADLGTLGALQAVEPLLEEAGLKEEAYTAYETLAEGLAKSHPAEAKAALKRVAEHGPTGALRNKAKKAADKIRK